MSKHWSCILSNFSFRASKLLDITVFYCLSCSKALTKSYRKIFVRVNWSDSSFSAASSSSVRDSERLSSYLMSWQLISLSTGVPTRLPRSNPSANDKKFSRSVWVLHFANSSLSSLSCYKILLSAFSRSRMSSATVYSRLIFGLFLTVFALAPKRRVLMVSDSWMEQGEQLSMRLVLAFPPRLSCRIRVSLESL